MLCHYLQKQSVFDLHLQLAAVHCLAGYTGKYWTPIYNILETTCTIVLAHPKYVKAIRGKKTDKKDTKWIADIFKHDLVSGRFIPSADIRQLRDLMRYYWKLTNSITSEIGVDMSVFPPRSTATPRLGLRRKTMRVLGRKRPPESAAPWPTSSPCSFSAHSAHTHHKFVL